MAGPQPPLPPVPNRDLLLRLSYTQQAATYLHLAQHAHDTEASGSGQASADAGISSKGKQPARVEADESASSSSDSKRRRGRTAKQHGAPGSLARLARSLASDIPRVTSHNKIRLDPTFKRALCKTCHTVLLPGLTAQVVTRPSRTHGHVVASTCAHCSTTKTLPRPPLYPLPLPIEELLAPIPNKTKGKRRARLGLPVAAEAQTADVSAASSMPPPSLMPPSTLSPAYSPPEQSYSPATPVISQTSPAYTDLGYSPTSPNYFLASPAFSLETPVFSPLSSSSSLAMPAAYAALAAGPSINSPDANELAPPSLVLSALPPPPPPARSVRSSQPEAAPTLRYNKRERRQMRLLARRSTITEEDRAKGERFKHGKRRPGGAPAGYGTGGGLDILSEREGVGHWRQEGQQGGWKAI